MNKLVIITGSNLGESKVLIREAKKNLEAVFGSTIADSPIVSSPAWGFKSNDFINQVIVFETSFSPDECLSFCLETEKKLGRTRNSNGGYSDRLIDIDILFYNSEIIKSNNLTIPHPLLHLRKFALLPLTLLMPDFVHPVLNKTISDLLQNCSDTSSVSIVLT
jgi:2-amino-4-hydroxy-6-hydroxymethyldihydropteridine diphosphokinase